MAIQQERFTENFKVTAATGSSYVIGYSSANDTVARATGTTVMPIGVIENSPTSSADTARVCTAGATKVHAGTSAIAIGDWLKADARGYAVADALGSTGPKLGVSKQTNTVDGELIEIEVRPMHATA